MNKPIGVLDSGIGGLSVVKAIEELLPNEDILYFGDNRNVPYGNKSEDEIYSLTMDMLKYFKENDVKMVAIACNTISAIAHRFKDGFSFPIIDIITPTIEHIENMGIQRLAIIATDFTIKTKAYENLLMSRNGSLKIFSESSHNLASLIDKGEFYEKSTYDTIKVHIENIKNKGNIYNVVLACTHYPIVEDIFMAVDPTLNYINPGFQQAKAMRVYLHKQGLLKREGKGIIEIYTSGDIGIYDKVIEKLGLKNVKKIENKNQF